MFFRNFLVPVLAAAFFLSANARAQDENREAFPADQQYSGKQSLEWEKIQNKLMSLKTKVDTQHGIIENLLAEKAHLTGEAQSAKAAELRAEYARLEKLTADYNTLNDEFKTRFPEKGIKESRTYRRIKLKTLDTLESELTLQGRVEKLHTKVLSQYPKSRKPENKKSKTATVVSGDITNGKKSEQDITDPILYKK